MKISDEMAEAACKSFFSDLGKEPTGGEDELRGFMRAAIEAAVGDLVLVPREPTTEMMCAACDVQGNMILREASRLKREWKAMLAAAPVSAHTQAGPVE